MQKSQATKKPAARRKVTNAVLKERQADKRVTPQLDPMAVAQSLIETENTPARHTTAADLVENALGIKEQNHTPFKWSDLDSFHDDCQSLFSVCIPIIEAIRSDEIQQKLKAQGKLEEFTSLANTLANDMQGYTTRLEAIRNSYKDRVVNEDNEPEEMMHGFTVAEDYRQWIDSFQAVVVGGLAADITIILDQLN